MINGSVVLAAFFSAAVFAFIHLLSNRIYRYSEKHRSKMLLGVILGGILFNAVKDSVPKGGGKNSSLFVSGALIYSFLLLVAAWPGG